MSQDLTTSKGIEQGRAKYAFAAVKSVSSGSDNSLKKQYKSAAKKLPILIKTNGLGQSLAFIKKRNEGYDKLYEQIGGWFRTKDAAHPLAQEGELIQKVIQLPSSTYRHVTVETLALLNWVRRFVDGLMQEVEEDND